MHLLDEVSSLPFWRGINLPALCLVFLSLLDFLSHALDPVETKQHSILLVQPCFFPFVAFKAARLHPVNNLISPSFTVAPFWLSEPACACTKSQLVFAWLGVTTVANVLRSVVFLR